MCTTDTLWKERKKKKKGAKGGRTDKLNLSWVINPGCFSIKNEHQPGRRALLASVPTHSVDQGATVGRCCWIDGLHCE